MILYDSVLLCMHNSVRHTTVCPSVLQLFLYVRMASASVCPYGFRFCSSVRIMTPSVCPNYNSVHLCVTRFCMSVWIITLSVSSTYDFARYISVTLVRTMFISVTFLLYILGTFSVLTPVLRGLRYMPAGTDAPGDTPPA